MGGLRSRLERVRRRLRPAGLAAEWERVLATLDERWGLATGREAVQGMAREAAATGRHPGDVLAELLVQHRGGAAP